MGDGPYALLGRAAGFRVGLVAVGGLVCLLNGVEPGERLVQLVPGDLVVVDVELEEDGLVEQSALIVVAAAVELLRVGQQGEAGLDEAGVVGQVLGGDLEPLGEALALAFDLAKLLLDPGLGQGAVSCQVDEVVFLGVEQVQLGGELLLSGIALRDALSAPLEDQPQAPRLEMLEFSVELLAQIMAAAEAADTWEEAVAARVAERTSEELAINPQRLRGRLS